MRQFDIVIYGSYGYTGSLITQTCKSKGLNVLLSGKDIEKLNEQAIATGYPFEVANINDHRALTNLLAKARLVIHCAGPFRSTAKQMIEACLETATHYTDITGEYEVFELLASYDAVAKEKGIIVMPGTGFDVVPSDCLAVHLKNLLPSAALLQLAFTMSKGGVSRGTARTMVEGLGYGSMIRKDGQLRAIALGAKVLDVEFCDFKTKALCIPWGDISTAWRSTGIPNIEVYSGVPRNTIRMAKLSSMFNWLLRKQWVKDYLRKKVDARPSGPGEQKLMHGKSYLWGRVTDSQGNTAEARFQTASGYLLTSQTSVLIAEKILSSSIDRPGYFTPAQYFGEGLIFEVNGTAWC